MSLAHPNSQHGEQCAERFAAKGGSLPCERCLFVVGLQARAAAYLGFSPGAPMWGWPELASTLMEAALLISKLQEEDFSRGKLIEKLAGVRNLRKAPER